MASQVFYRKWRPVTLSDVFGQEHVTQTLRNALASGRLGHAYLFCGPRGTGKTSTGRILAKAANCLDLKEGEPCNQCDICQAVNKGSALDIIEIDAASNRGIDEIRDLRGKVSYVPSLTKYKVYIIDEVHMLTEAASNALLKTLEEPPAHAIFVLATTEPHKVLATILSRCQRFDFRRLSQVPIVAKLKAICEQEGIDIGSEALRIVARSATGSLRDAENILEQLVAYFGRNVSLAQAQSILNISTDARVQELVNHVINHGLAAGLRTIASVNSDGLDLRQFNRGVVEYLRNLLLVKAGSEEVVDVTKEDLGEMKGLVANVTVERLLKFVNTFNAVDLRLDNYSSLPLELALVECSLGVNDKANVVPYNEQARTVLTPAVSLSKAQEAETLSQPVIANTPCLSDGAVQDIGYFRAHWKEFIESLRGEGSTGTLDALLRSACRPLALEEDTLTLGFYYPYHKEKVEDPKYRHLIQRKLKQVFGRDYQLRCELTSREEPGQQKKSSMLKAVLEMGGKIVDDDN